MGVVVDFEGGWLECLDELMEGISFAFTAYFHAALTFVLMISSRGDWEAIVLVV